MPVKSSDSRNANRSKVVCVAVVLPSGANARFRIPLAEIKRFVVALATRGLITEANAELLLILLGAETE